MGKRSAYEGRWYEVDRAIRQAVENRSHVPAIDYEARAGRHTQERANPRRTLTVRPTGHEGSPRRREPLDAVERGRMKDLLAELPGLRRNLVIGHAVGKPHRALIAELRSKGYRFDDHLVWVYIDQARATLEARMREVGLLA